MKNQPQHKAPGPDVPGPPLNTNDPKRKPVVRTEKLMTILGPLADYGGTELIHFDRLKRHFDTVVDEDGRPGTPLHEAMMLTFISPNFQRLVAGMLFGQAELKLPSQTYMDSSLDLCLSMITGPEKWIDTRVLHQILEVSQPYHFWIARLIVGIGLRLGTEYRSKLREPFTVVSARKSTYLVTPTVAAEIAISAYTPRGRILREVYVTWAQKWLQRPKLSTQTTA